ncbi:MAG: LysM peptidoglycan-binding domain-containing M23 family metallopeptidase [Sphingomonadaceae bacterium]|nr:LysM peptidoglycan-binding domain-containing M23 family metallopeptidase [Sphingomonadaceae bacterium]
MLPVGLALLLCSASVFAVPPGEEAEHVVKAGETLNGIANRAGVARDKIIKANGLAAPFVIRIGQTLTIPRKIKAASRAIAARQAPLPSLAAANSHVVRPGETLGSIALRAEIPRILIAEANSLAPPFTIRVGQKLVLPRTRRHAVKPGDTGFGIAYQYGVPWENIAIANGLDPKAAVLSGKTLLIPTLIEPSKVPQATALPSTGPTTGPTTAPAAAPVAVASTRFAWPVSGSVRRKFTPRGSGSYHDGLDIVAPRETAVRAAAAGTVIFARKESKQFGNLVVVDHGGGWHSVYGSLGRITVKKGHKVTKGERVGLVGDTSVTGKTELHFELRKDGTPIDPARELPAAP